MLKGAKEMYVATWMLQTKQVDIQHSGRGISGQNEVPFHRAGMAKRWKPIAIGFGIATFSFFSYALVDQQYDGASANTRRGTPQSFPHRFTPPLRLDTVHIPAGTRINIRLEEDIRTRPEKDISGDGFTAVLYGPLIVGTNFLAPSRSKIIGQLTQATGHDGAEAHGQLRMVLRKLLVNGKEYDIATDPVFLDLGIQGSPIVYGPESQFTFTLSDPLELPVIRSMGGVKGGSVNGGNQ